MHIFYILLTCILLIQTTASQRQHVLGKAAVAWQSCIFNQLTVKLNCLGLVLGELLFPILLCFSCWFLATISLYVNQISSSMELTSNLSHSDKYLPWPMWSFHNLCFVHRCGEVYCKKCLKQQRRLNTFANYDPQGKFYKVSPLSKVDIHVEYLFVDWQSIFV